MIVANLVACFLAIGLSFGVAIQIAACRRPFSDRREQAISFVCALIWLWRPTQVVIGIVDGSFDVTRITLINWIATDLFIIVMMRVLWRAEERNTDFPAKSAVFESDAAITRRLAAETVEAVRRA